MLVQLSGISLCCGDVKEAEAEPALRLRRAGPLAPPLLSPGLAAATSSSVSSLRWQWLVELDECSTFGNNRLCVYKGGHSRPVVVPLGFHLRRWRSLTSPPSERPSRMTSKGESFSLAPRVF